MIPTESDWRSEPWGIDTPHAYKHFFGKSKEEASALFKEDEGYYAEDLLYMPKPCLDYYVEAYIEHLDKEEFSLEYHERFRLAGLIEFRQKEFKETNRETLNRIEGLLIEWHLAEQNAIGSEFTQAKAALELIREIIA